MVNRSVNTSVNHRSYAEVLQSGCKNASVVTSHKLRTHRETTGNLPFASITADEFVNCVPTKCVPLERNVKPIANRNISGIKRNDTVKGKPYTQELPLPLQNRYQICNF